MSLCLSVCSCNWKNHAAERHQIFYACCMWPWLDPPTLCIVLPVRGSPVLMTYKCRSIGRRTLCISGIGSDKQQIFLIPLGELHFGLLLIAEKWYGILHYEAYHLQKWYGYCRVCRIGSAASASSLQMKSCFHVMGPMGRITEDVMYRRSLPGGDTIPVGRQKTTVFSWRGKVCCLWLPCFIWEWLLFFYITFGLSC